jgi:hypothetical protein
MHGSFALLLMNKSKLCREERLKTAKGLVPRREPISRIPGAHPPRRDPVPSISLAPGRIHEHLLENECFCSGESARNYFAVPPPSLSDLPDDRERKPTLARIAAEVNALQATSLWHRGDGVSVLICNGLQAVLV